MHRSTDTHPILTRCQTLMDTQWAVADSDPKTLATTNGVSFDDKVTTWSFILPDISTDDEENVIFDFSVIKANSRSRVVQSRYVEDPRDDPSTISDSYTDTDPSYCGPGAIHALSLSGTAQCSSLPQSKSTDLRTSSNTQATSPASHTVSSWSPSSSSSLNLRPLPELQLQNSTVRSSLGSGTSATSDSTESSTHTASLTEDTIPVLIQEHIVPGCLSAHSSRLQGSQFSDLHHLDSTLLPRSKASTPATDISDLGSDFTNLTSLVTSVPSLFVGNLSGPFVTLLVNPELDQTIPLAVNSLLHQPLPSIPLRNSRSSLDQYPSSFFPAGIIPMQRYSEEDTLDDCMNELRAVYRTTLSGENLPASLNDNTSSFPVPKFVPSRQPKPESPSLGADPPLSPTEVKAQALETGALSYDHLTGLQTKRFSFLRRKKPPKALSISDLSAGQAATEDLPLFSAKGKSLADELDHEVERHTKVHVKVSECVMFTFCIFLVVGLIPFWIHSTMNVASTQIFLATKMKYRSSPSLPNKILVPNTS